LDVPQVCVCSTGGVGQNEKQKRCSPVSKRRKRPRAWGNCGEGKEKETDGYTGTLAITANGRGGLTRLRQGLMSQKKEEKNRRQDGKGERT